MKQRAKFAVRASLAMVTFASIFPLTTYADTKTSNVSVTATINPSISVDAASGFSITGDAGSVMNGVISATVTANTKYTIGLKVKDGSASTAMVSELGESIPASSAVAANTNAWGVKKKTSSGGNADAYSAVTMTNENFFTSTGPSDGKTPVNFQVGISTSSSIAAGSYSVNLTLTAAPATP